MRHHATERFWRLYEALPEEAQRLADKSFRLLADDPRHPSLHFKKIGRFWSARVGARYRALAVEREDDLAWFWIGDHDTYDRLIKGA